MKKDVRLILMVIILSAAAAGASYLMHSSGNEQVPQREDLSRFPETTGDWTMTEDRQLTAGEMRELKADDYLSRTYRSSEGLTAYLFIAFYSSQRHRQTLHSPQNCLPGSGWTMGDHRIHSPGNDSQGRRREINEYVIEKDGSQMLAFYWYHGRGRVDAGDFIGRVHTISDAVMLGRTDGAIVRVITPLAGAESENRARASALALIDQLLADLDRYIPR